MGFRFGSCYVQFPAGAMSNRGNGSGCVESALDGGAAERFMAKAKNRAALLQATKRPAPPKAAAGKSKAPATPSPANPSLDSARGSSGEPSPDGANSGVSFSVQSQLYCM